MMNHQRTKLVLITSLAAGIPILFAVTILPRNTVTIHDPRLEIIGIKCSYGTNHGGFPGGRLQRSIRSYIRHCGYRIPQIPDDRFDSAEPRHAIVLRYRSSIPMTFGPFLPPELLYDE